MGRRKQISTFLAAVSLSEVPSGTGPWCAPEGLTSSAPLQTIVEKNKS